VHTLGIRFCENEKLVGQRKAFALVAVGHHLVSFVVGCIVVVAMWDSL
jgi:hypothetical protein